MELTIAIEIHGCKLNHADSEEMARRFNDQGYRLVDVDDGPDVIVVNSCTVTHVADAKARHTLRAAKRRKSNPIVIATGCYAERDPRTLLKMASVDLVAGNREKGELVELTKLVTAGRLSYNKSEKRPDHSYRIRSKAMIKIQEGCNQICSFCIIPRVRGRERSVPVGLLIKEIQSRSSEGFREVVLTGTQLGSYGFDLENVDLTRLVALILEKTSIERLRLSSVQPQEFTPNLLDLWGNPRLCPHFHIPLQSASPAVLAKMRRRYSPGLFSAKVQEIQDRFPEAAITTDVIVGFPGEGNLEYEQTLEFCSRVDFADMHVFPYSVRPRTTAAHLFGKVHPIEKKERMNRMLALSIIKSNTFRKRSLGQTRSVLWEATKTKDGIFSGLTDNYLRVHTRSQKDLTNRITLARLTSFQNGILSGENIV